MWPFFVLGGRKIRRKNGGKDERKILSRNLAASVSLVLSIPRLAEEHLLVSGAPRAPVRCVAIAVFPEPPLTLCSVCTPCSAEAFLGVEARDQDSLRQRPRHAQVPGLERGVRGLRDSRKPAREIQTGSLRFPHVCSAYSHPRYRSHKL